MNAIRRPFWVSDVCSTGFSRKPHLTIALGQPKQVSRDSPALTTQKYLFLLPLGGEGARRADEGVTAQVPDGRSPLTGPAPPSSHSRAGGSPEVFGSLGFPPARERLWIELHGILHLIEASVQ